VRVYLDHNATSPLRPEVKAAMIAAMDLQGNASSIHGEGRKARKAIDDAREALAFALGCLPQMMTFTSGGTEANNMAIRGVGAERIIIAATEHTSVLDAAKASGKDVVRVPVDDQGRIDLLALDAAIEGANVLVSVMLANNETGVLQPVDDIVTIAKAKGAMVHVDAVQAFRKHRFSFGLLGADLVTIAAHKVGGPKGIGALITRDGVVVEPLIQGGGQELRRRSGTENVVGIAGFGAIAALADVDCGDLTDQLDAGLSMHEDITIFSNLRARLSNTTCFAVPGMKAETLLMNLDLEGFAVSSGSACSSGKVGRSHVLDAMGVAPAISSGAIRVSLGWNTTAEDVSRFISTLNSLRARHIARLAA
jgi:cysteine desulfurase